MRSTCVSITLLTLAAALPAVEITPPTTNLNEVVTVTADRRETPLGSSTASVAVVDAADDRERGYVLSPWEWLEGIAGVVRPGYFQLRYILGSDLGERRVASARGIAAVGWPILLGQSESGQ